MKKILPLLFICLFLTSCSIKVLTPTIKTIFNQRAIVNVGDFSYSCSICRNDKKEVVVEVLSSSAKGMIINYDGKSVEYSFNGNEYSIDGNGIDKTNIAIAIYDVFDYLEKEENITSKSTENGYKYVGSTSIGKFILIQNRNETYKSIVFQNADISVEFE